ASGRAKRCHEDMGSGALEQTTLCVAATEGVARSGDDRGITPVITRAYGVGLHVDDHGASGRRHPLPRTRRGYLGRRELQCRSCCKLYRRFSDIKQRQTAIPVRLAHVSRRSEHAPAEPAPGQRVARTRENGFEHNPRSLLEGPALPKDSNEFM